MNAILDTIQNLHTALAAAQGEFEQIRRDKSVTVTMKSGGKYSFSYAPLESILHSVTPALSRNGLSLTQATTMIESGKEFVETTLRHSSGETLKNLIPIFVRDDGPQAYGSALTYARRYGVTLLLCISADDDDDANAAEGNSAEVTRQRSNGNGHKEPDRSLEAQLLASNFKAAIEAGEDAKVFKVHNDANHDQELYQLAWKLLDSKVRTGVKNAIGRSRGEHN